MRDRVRITDVSPRDGLQNEPGTIPTEEKVGLVDLLCRTGVDEVEVSSFVSPKWVPQLGDAVAVFEQVAGRLETMRARNGALPVLSALVPNEKGMDAALEVNRRAGRTLIGKVCMFTAASETFNKTNTNATIAESFVRFEPVVSAAVRCGLAVRVYISCAIACPYEGEIKPAQVYGVFSRAAALLTHSSYWRSLDQPGLGGHEVVLGDTIGAGTPGKIGLLLRPILDGGWLHDLENPPGSRTEALGLHLHDTFGRAAECVREALRLGVRSFDGSVAGLGGCPYASTLGKRAPGNISTETLVRTIHEAGYETGVDLDRLEEAAAFARQIVAGARARAGGGGP